MSEPLFKIGDRVRVVIEGKGWVGPASDQLHGRTGVVTDTDTIGSSAQIFGPCYTVKFDQPLDLGWRSIEAMWFNDEFLEVLHA